MHANAGFSTEACAYEGPMIDAREAKSEVLTLVTCACMLTQMYVTKVSGIGEDRYVPHGANTAACIAA